MQILVDLDCGMYFVHHCRRSGVLIRFKPLRMILGSMAETEVVSPPSEPTPVPEGESSAGKESSTAERRDGKPERNRREEDIPDMTVEEAHKALNALPKVSCPLIEFSC